LVAIGEQVFAGEKIDNAVFDDDGKIIRIVFDKGNDEKEVVEVENQN